MLLLPKNLEVLERLAAESGTIGGRLGGLASVRLTVTADGYRAEATNGKVLGIVTGPAGSPDKFPTAALPATASDTATEALVPGDAWKEAFKGLPRRGTGLALGHV